MTRNQINYAQLLETQRTNRAQESLTGARDVRAHLVSLANLSEAQRHNVETEGQARAVLGETQRSNLAKESETQRSNLAKESEIARHNLANESLTGRQIESSYNLGMANVGLGYSELKESARRTGLQIDLGNRQLKETTRSNMMNESIRRAQVIEDKRHNKVVESETAKHHENQDWVDAYNAGVNTAGTILKGASTVISLLGGN